MKSSQGIVYKRREKILQLLKEKKRVIIKDLSSLLNVSEITIRRDLQEFEDEGIVDRFYGGAVLKEKKLILEDTDQSYAKETYDFNSNEIKNSIALEASKMVEDEDIIFINSGSTAFQLLNTLSNKNITIVTNNGRAIGQPKPAAANIVVSGGEIYERKQSLVGDFAMNTFSKIEANICFLSVGGITKEGITTFALPETAVNRTILERTNGPRVILAEGFKIGRFNNFETADIALITHLITDSSADRNEINNLKIKGVEVIFIDNEEL